MIIVFTAIFYSAILYALIKSYFVYKIYKTLGSKLLLISLLILSSVIIIFPIINLMGFKDIKKLIMPISILAYLTFIAGVFVILTKERKLFGEWGRAGIFKLMQKKVINNIDKSHEYDEFSRKKYFRELILSGIIYLAVSFLCLLYDKILSLLFVTESIIFFLCGCYFIKKRNK